MSYFVALPCMLAVYFYARSLELPGSYFATVCLLLTVIVAASGSIVPGVDAIVAACLTMGILNAANWYVDQQLTKELDAGLVELAPPPPVNPFCSTQSHDFALAPADCDFVIEKINAEDWPAVQRIVNGFSAVERQGFYANLNYGSICPLAALNFVNSAAQCSDAHILFGHVKLCLAKEMGLVPGVMPDEEAAAAVALAFKHFRSALRQDGDDVEALCGLILAKGFIALNGEHIESTLQKLLALDPLHFHGLIAAGRFLIRSPAGANDFVSMVETCVKDSEVTLAVARLLAHVECASLRAGGATDSRVIADHYAQLKIYKKDYQSLGAWQQGIASNVIAYAFEMIGDNEEKTRQLSGLNGVVSPYPWKQKRAVNEAVLGVMAG